MPPYITTVLRRLRRLLSGGAEEAFEAAADFLLQHLLAGACDRPRAMLVSAWVSTRGRVKDPWTGSWMTCPRNAER